MCLVIMWMAVKPSYLSFERRDQKNFVVLCSICWWEVSLLPWLFLRWVILLQFQCWIIKLWKNFELCSPSWAILLVISTSKVFLLVDFTHWAVWKTIALGQQGIHLFHESFAIEFHYRSFNKTKILRNETLTILFQIQSKRKWIWKLVNI